jgi:nucleoside-diphosphate-sugar epimerase
MRVFVAGAAGAVGKPLVRELISRGHEVTATTRDPEKSEEIRALGATPTLLDGLDAAAVGQAVARAEPDVIVHEMTALATTPDMRHFDRWFALTNRLRTVGARNLVSAARATGASRVVAQSYTGWNNRRDLSLPVTEEDPFDAHPAREQRESLAAIETLEQTVLDAPLDGAVMRYGNLYGPGASESFVDLLRRRRLPIIGDGSGIWSWIHVDDAASATALAIEGRSRGVYNVVDDEPASVREFLPYLAEAVGAKPPLRIPVWLARLLAGDVIVGWMTEGSGTSNAKAKRELGWQPTWATWRDGFRQGLGIETPSDTRPRGAATT